MKNLCLCSFFLLLFFSSFGQNENNHWQLGTTDLNFINNPPTVSTVSNSGQHGNASISDSNGNLLFYTNGITVWNKNHQVMTHGEDNYYQIHSQQPVVILPLPGNVNKYYIFYVVSTTTLGDNINSYYYTYSIVDFTNNSLGELVDLDLGLPVAYRREISQSHIEGSGFYGPLTVAKNSTDDGYWIIVRGRGAGGFNELFSFALTSSGLNQTPVNSTYTSYVTSGYNVLKISPDNTKLGFLESNSAFSTSKFYTFNFNSGTGAFTNQNLITVTSPSFSAYNFAFSSDSQKIYFCKNNLFVKDLANLSTPARYIVSSFPQNLEQMQRDVNGNILITSSGSGGSANIQRINNQDSFSTSTLLSGFITLNSTLNDPNSLPQLIPSLIAPCPTNLVVTTNVVAGTDTKQASGTITASNVINNPAIGIYHAGTSVILTTGFHAANGSRFRGYIEGCTGNFIGKDSEEKDVVTDEAGLLVSEAKATLYPNPTNSIVTVALSGSVLKNIHILSLDGKIVFSLDSINNVSQEINVSALEKGIYILTIETGEGKVMTQKLIKN